MTIPCKKTGFTSWGYYPQWTQVAVSPLFTAPPWKLIRLCIVDNISIQYNPGFNLWLAFFSWRLDIFLIYVTNRFEVLYWGGSNRYPQSIFWVKLWRLIYAPASPDLSLHKVRYTGVFTAWSLYHNDELKTISYQ